MSWLASYLIILSIIVGFEFQLLEFFDIFWSFRPWRPCPSVNRAPTLPHTFAKSTITLLDFGNIAPASFWPKNPPKLPFSGFASVSLLLSDLVSQFFFPFSLDIYPFWRINILSVGSCSLLHYFHWVFPVEWSLKPMHCFSLLISWVKTLVKVIEGLQTSLSRFHSSSLFFNFCFWVWSLFSSLIVSFLSLFRFDCYERVYCLCEFCLC
jgi:hypothetical protein